MGRISKIILSLLLTLCLLPVVQKDTVITANAESIDSQYVAVLKSGNTIVRRYTGSMANAWASAISSGYSDKVFVLNSDWESDNNGSFGSGTGFAQGRISVNKSITIDLNGHDIDRGLKMPMNNGQVIRVGGDNTLTVIDSVGGGKITGGYNTDCGGGVYLADAGSSLNLYGGSITGNIAKYGAGVYINKDGSRLRLAPGGSISYNNAKKKGGGVYIYNGAMNMWGGEVSYNRAQGDTTYADGGGGIYVDDDGKTLNISGGKIIYNAAVNNGAGIYVWDGNINVQNAEISNNVAQHSGGALYDREGDHYFKNVRFEGNFSDKHGSVMTLGYSGTRLVNCVVTNNVVRHSDGAAIYNWDPVGLGKTKVYLDDGTIVSKNRTIEGSNDKWDTAFDQESTAYWGGSHIYDDNLSGNLTNDSDINKWITPVSAQTPSATDYVTGTYNFSDVQAIQDISTEFVYQDAYFDNAGTTYNNHLATMSLNLAMSAFAAYSDASGETDMAVIKAKEANGEYGDGLGRDHNVADLFDKIGFTNFESNYPSPSIETIGYSLAQKQLSDGTTVIGIAMRGANYEFEWASNVTIGRTGEHEGFASSADQVYAALGKYLQKWGLNSNKVKFWVVGYSRGGAVANLTAKRIIDNYNKDGSRVYAYSFEPPKGGVESAKVSGSNYSGINCILNKTDIVPYVAPSEMGFIHYGRITYIPGETVETVNYVGRRYLMKKQLANINKDVYNDFTDKFRGGTINTLKAVALDFIQELGLDRFDVWAPRFVNNLTTWLDVDERSNFVRKNTGLPLSYEEALQDLMSLAFYVSDEQLLEIKESFVVSNLISLDNIALVVGMFALLYIDGTWRIGTKDASLADGIAMYMLQQIQINERSAYNKIEEALQGAGVNAGNLSGDVLAILNLALLFVSDDYVNNYADNIGTLLTNTSTLMQGHYPEINLAWLRTYDSYYDYLTGKATSTHNAPTSLDVEIVEDTLTPYANVTFKYNDTYVSPTSYTYSYDCGSDKKNTVEITNNKNANIISNVIQNTSEKEMACKVTVTAKVNGNNTLPATEEFTIPARQVIEAVDGTFRNVKEKASQITANQIAVLKGGSVTIVADEIAHKRFVNWTVESKDTSKTVDATITDENKSVTTLTVGDNRAFKVIANYVDKISKINVDFSPYDTGAATWGWVDGETNKNAAISLISENKPEGSNTVTSNWKLTLNKSDLGVEQFDDEITATLTTDQDTNPQFMTAEIAVDENNKQKIVIGEDSVEVYVTTTYHEHSYGTWTEYVSTHENYDSYHYRECNDANCPDDLKGIQLKVHQYSSTYTKVEKDGSTWREYICTICGHKGLFHDHDHVGNIWYSDEDTHYHICTFKDDDGNECGAHFDVTAHDFNDSGICKTCGYEKEMTRTIIISQSDTDPLNLNAINKAWTDSQTISFKGTSSDVHTLVAPSESDEKFINWNVPENSGIVITDKDGKELTSEELEKALKSTTLNFKYKLTKGTDDVYSTYVIKDVGAIDAMYKPVAKAVDIATKNTGTDEKPSYLVPTAGENLPSIETFNITITNEYGKDQINKFSKIYWEYGEGEDAVRIVEEDFSKTIAKYNETYRLVIEVDGIDRGKYEFSDSWKLSINGSIVNPAETVTVKTNENGTTYSVLTYEFEKTALPTLANVEVDEDSTEIPEDKEVVDLDNLVWNTTVEEWMLPKMANLEAVEKDNGAVIPDQEITWDLSTFDPTLVGEQVIYGSVAIPEDVTIPEDVSLTVAYTVNVLPPVLNAPSVTFVESENPSVMDVKIDYPNDEISKLGKLMYKYVIYNEKGEIETESEELSISDGTTISISLDNGYITENKRVSVTSWITLADTDSEKTEVSKVADDLTYYDVVIHAYAKEDEEIVDEQKHLAGSQVRIYANEREGYLFSHWQILSGSEDVTDSLLKVKTDDGETDNTANPETSFTVPAQNVEVWPIYQEIVWGTANITINRENAVSDEVATLPAMEGKIKVTSTTNGKAYNLDGTEAEGDGWITISIPEGETTTLITFENILAGDYNIEYTGFVGEGIYDWDINLSQETFTVEKNEETDITFNATYKKLEDIEYKFTIGMEQSVDIASQEEIYFKTNGRHDLLTSIMIDGKVLKNGVDYRTESGSTHIWISPNYYHQLSVGRHSITATYQYHDEPVQTIFKLTKTDNGSKNVDTGDGSNQAAWMITLFGSLLVFISALFLKKKHS